MPQAAHTPRLGALAVSICLLLNACGGGGGSGSGTPSTATVTTPANTQPLQNVGFFTPRGLPAELVNQTAFNLVYYDNLQQLNSSLQTAATGQTQIVLDLTARLTTFKDMELNRTYTARDGVVRTRQLPFVQKAKIIKFVDDNTLLNVFNQVFDAMQRYPQQVRTVFLVDEPYLNGISKQELERVGRIFKSVQSTYGNLQHIKLGLIFSSGMFNASYAQTVDREAGEYVKSIDEFYARASKGTPQEQAEAERVLKNRLVTYNQAGNSYLQGGLPDGFDQVGFDLYLSTLLLDTTQSRSMAWLADNTAEATCKLFKGTTMPDIRKRLSFFKDGPVATDAERAGDDATLTSLFNCRMNALTDLLTAQAKAKGMDVFMIAESSSNGLLEFTANGDIEKDQPQAIVEKRVLDEVERGLKFYDARKASLKGGLYFFTYADELDEVLQLTVKGASGLPTVKEKIFAYTKK